MTINSMLNRIQKSNVFSKKDSLTKSSSASILSEISSEISNPEIENTSVNKIQIWGTQS